jgi:cytochrome c551/c552
MTYTWDLGNGTKQNTTVPELSYTFTTAGDYNISVEAKDDQGATAKSENVSVYAGNEEPKVSIELTSGNKSFYLPGTPVHYTVNVKDNDTAKLDPANLYVAVDYIEGYDKAATPTGHQQGAATVSGKQLTQTLDCKSCHKEADKSIGPAFLLVAQKYQNDPKAASYLAQKITKGGSGVWGDVAMSAHPAISQDDLSQIVTYVLSLGNKAAVKKSLPPAGSVTPPADTKANATMVISASYTDKGGNNVKALTGKTTTTLSSNTLYFSGLEKTKGFVPFKYNDQQIMIFPTGEGYFPSASVDLSGVHSINLACGWQAPPKGTVDFEARLDSPDGKVVGKGSVAPITKKGQLFGIAHVSISPVTDGNLHVVYFLYKAKEPISGGVVSLQFASK